MSNAATVPLNGTGTPSSPTRWRFRGDKYIWSSVLLLGIISVLLVYSTTGTLAYKRDGGTNEFDLFKQMFFMSIGFICMYFLHRVNYILYSRIAAVLFAFSLPFLLYTYFFGVDLNEGKRWVRVPFINLTLQTSDFARLALFMYLSRVLSKRQDSIKDFSKGFLPLMVPVLLTCGLIAPANLSTALLTGATSMLVMFIGRVNIKHLLGTVLAMLLVIGCLVTYLMLSEGKTRGKDSRNTKSAPGLFRSDTWKARTLAFFSGNKETMPDQLKFSMIAISNGGLLVGRGPGNSQQKNFLPHSYSDFVYAIIIEEYGLLGGALVMVIYLVFVYRGIRIFKRCPYAFGAFLAISLSFMLMIQALANMAVTVGLVPVTGVTLPLISMGGSSFLFSCASIGILLSVARNVENMEGEGMAKTAVA